MVNARNDVPNFFEEYQAAATADPASASALTNLGWGFYGKGQLAEAAEAFQKAIAIDANKLDAHYGLALASKKHGLTKEAVAAFQSALALLENIEDAARAQLMRRIIKSHLKDLHALQ